MADVVASVAAAMTRLMPAWADVPGVVAVSGGADSVALLRALHQADPPGGLVVAHLNHQLRGDESDADAAFVRDLADRLCKTFHVEGCASLNRSGNLEATARAVRYDWLAEVAAASGAGWIATGHTADDQAETVLHRLMRGAGVTGLRGIAGRRRYSVASGGRQPPVGDDVTGGLRPPLARDKESPPILRPLLGVTRAELLAYLAALGQPFRTDSSNADLAFTRNRIRAELLPLLRTFNPAVVAVLGRLAVQAEELAEWVAGDTAKLLLDAELPRAGDTVILDGEELHAAGEVRTRSLVRFVWDREQWPVNGMTFAHWKRAAAVALGDPPAADFPDGVHVRNAGKVVQLRRRS